MPARWSADALIAFHPTRHPPPHVRRLANQLTLSTLSEISPSRPSEVARAMVSRQCVRERSGPPALRTDCRSAATARRIERQAAGVREERRAQSGGPAAHLVGGVVGGGHLALHDADGVTCREEVLPRLGRLPPRRRPLLRRRRRPRLRPATLSHLHPVDVERSALHHVVERNDVTPRLGEHSRGVVPDVLLAEAWTRPACTGWLHVGWPRLAARRRRRGE